jgi:DNA segregation ATPase FtsK/SpoIIIE, S-DNA-T family
MHGNVASLRGGRVSARSAGREVRALAWLIRHPLFLAVPVALAVAVRMWGPVPVGWLVGGLVAGAMGWWRAHPPSFDRWAAPALRSASRRWTVYRGRRWQHLLGDCELTREHRRTGETLCPRVLRVRSITPSIDVVLVRLVGGQEPATWIERAVVLAEALRAERVAISRRRPGVLTVIVERRNPFPRVVDAAPIPDTCAEVDLSRLDVGDTEYGGPFYLNLRGRRLLVVGASGAGKGSLLWNPLRAIGPMIRDSLVRLWVIDLKGGTETDRGQVLFHRWATSMDDAVALLEDFRDSMLARQQHMRGQHVRQSAISVDTPYELLIIDLCRHRDYAALGPVCAGQRG